MTEAAERFAVKLAPRYDGPYKVVNFVSPLPCRHVGTKNKKGAHLSELKTQPKEAAQPKANLNKEDKRSDLSKTDNCVLKRTHSQFFVSDYTHHKLKLLSHSILYAPINKNNNNKK